MQVQNFGSSQFNAANTNAVLSQFATDNNYDKLPFLMAAIDSMITDGWPTEFLDMTLFLQKGKDLKQSDEFFWFQNDYDRQPLIVSSNTTGGVQVLTVPVVTTLGIAVSDGLYGIGGGKSATVIGINNSNSTVTLRADSGMVLPNFTASQTLPFIAPQVPLGSRKDVPATYRMTPSKFVNYVCAYAEKTEYDWITMMKLSSDLNQLSDYIGTEFGNMIRTLKQSGRNNFWQSNRGQTILTDGRSAKKMGGIRWFLTNYGSSFANPTPANFADTVRLQARQTQFKKTGATKYLFCSPEVAAMYMDSYKVNSGVNSNVRYSPNDKIANLNLPEVVTETTRIVVVSQQCFTDTSSFDRDFGRAYFLLDSEEIKPIGVDGYDWAKDINQRTDPGSLGEGILRAAGMSMSLKMGIPSSHAWGFVN